jgi:hypothetical protein
MALQQHIIETDLLVAGGGMAGVCAAIAAARTGAKVVLVQDRSCLGGNASSEIRMHIVGADNHGNRKGWRESGIMEELRLEDAVRNPERCYPLWDVILYEKVMAEPHITLLLDTDIVGADVDVAHCGDAAFDRPPRTERMYEFHGPRNITIKSARAVRQLTQDEFIIKAKMYADCTGDGRLGFEAGADFRIGREGRKMHNERLAEEGDDVHTLGSSILLTSRRFDHPVPFAPPPWARKFTSENLGKYRTFRAWDYGFWWIEWGGHLDTIKDNCTTIRHELYRIALGLWDYVKNSGRFPESANWGLDWIGHIPGKRESRRFLGPHILSERDLVESRVFEDEVAYGGWTIDLHPIRGIDQIDQPPCSQHKLENCYGIPLRSYFSRNVQNLFFAGRNISATHVAFASTRVMATCAVGGQAVGHAAALCAKRGINPAELVADKARLRELHQVLLQHDVTLLNTRPERNLSAAAAITASSQAPGAPAENVRNGFTRDVVDPDTGNLIEARGWRSAPLESGEPWIELTWDRPLDLARIELTFDTGFQRELMLSPSNAMSARLIRAAQPETVRDYTLSLDGVVIERVEGNYQRHRIHRIDRKAKSLRLTIHATHGAPEARVFEIAVR